MSLLEAVALVLIIEALLPLIAPNFWRHMVANISQLTDAKLRFNAALLMLVGIILLLVV